MSSKMSVVAAIELVNALGYTSGEPIMWELVKALRNGTLSPTVLQPRR